MTASGAIRVDIRPTPSSDPAAIGREVARALRAYTTRGRWEQQWKALSGVSWSEWVRLHRSKRVRILLAERDEDVRVWIDDHEVHGVIRSVAVTRSVWNHGDVTLTIPLGLVELL